MEERLGRDKREREQKAKARRGKWHKYSLTVIDQFVSLPPLFPSSGVIRHPGEGVQREEKTLRTCGVFGQHFHNPPSPRIEIYRSRTSLPNQCEFLNFLS